MNQFHPSVVKLDVLRRKEQIQLKILVRLGIVLVAIFAGWWFQPQHITHNFSGVWHIVDVVLFLLLSFVVWHQIVNEMFTWYVSLDMKKPKLMKPESGMKVAFLTAFVPGKEPYDILEATLKAMVECDYQHDTWLLDEGDDKIAKQICLKLGVKHFTRRNVPMYNSSQGPYKAKTKGGNYNAWYHKYAHSYDYVAQLDVDFIPKKNYLVNCLGYFKDPAVAFVGTPQIYGNRSGSWIERGAAEQAFNFYGTIQRGLFGKNTFLFIGANHIVRVAAHADIGGYSGHIVEDHLTGMRFYEKKWKSVYVPEILAVGEGPSTWDAYFSQQMRWAYGLIHILFTQSPKIFSKMRINHTINYFFLQQFYFNGIAQGIGVSLLLLYFLFGIQATSMQMIPLLLLYVPILMYQIYLALWLQRTNIERKNESGLLMKGKMLSMAAWPIYLLAFIGVVVGVRLNYKVTPKGNAQQVHVNSFLFFPHFLLGTLTLIGLICAFILHHVAIQLLFFGAINTILMYAIIFVGHFEVINDRLRTLRNVLVSTRFNIYFQKLFSS